MASKVEILGGTLDGSILDNAASESTLRELVEAVKQLEASTTRNTRLGASGSGAASALNINTGPANNALNTMSAGVGRAGKVLSSSLGSMSKGIASTASGLTNAISNMAGQMVSGQNNLSGFVGALGALPGPMGKLASVIAGGIKVLEGYQEQQRAAANVGASFNNSMMEMRIAAAQAGMSLEDYGKFVRQNAQNIGGLGDTITDGAKKLSEVANAVGTSRLDEDFMKLGMSSQGARMAAMRFSTELVKSDRVRGASATELARASLNYEKDLDLLAKQTGKSKEELRAFSEGLVKRGGAVQFAFSRMPPEVQAAMKSVMNSVGATMGEGAQEALVDLISGAAAPSSEASALFQSQMPGVVDAFREMREVANDTSLSDAERKAKTDQLMARAQAEQLQFLQSEQGRFLMENKERLAKANPAYASFISGLEKNAKALSEQGIDINNATQADIERVTAAKRAEQERQAQLDKGFNAFQATVTRISTSIQTTFFSILSPILERIAGGLESMMSSFSNIGSNLEGMGIAVETITPAINFVVDMLEITLGGAFEGMSFVVSKVWNGLMSLLDPIKDLFAAFGIGVPTSNDLINGFKSLIDIVGSVFIIVKDILGGAFDFLFHIIRTMIGAVTDVVNLFRTAFEPQIRFVVDKLKQFGDYVMNLGAEILNGIRAMFSAEGAKALVAGVKSMTAQASGKLLETIGDILPKWAGGEKLAQTGKDLLASAEQQRQEYNEQKKAAQEQAQTRTAAVNEEINAKKQQTAQATENFKKNLATGREELKARLERERIEKESAEKRKLIEKDKEIADAMERSRQAAIKRMQELAGIKPFEGARRGDRADMRPPGSVPGETGGAPMPQVPADLKSYLAATALVESGGKADAKAKTSSAGGMFQFLDSTWEAMVKEMGKNYTLQDKFDPAKATEVMTYFTQKQQKQLEKNIGRKASNTDLYMAHFLGVGDNKSGATEFLKALESNPNQRAADLDPAAAKANKSIFHELDKSGKIIRDRTVKEVYELMQKKIGGAEKAVAQGKWGGQDIPSTVAALKSQISPEEMARMQAASTAAGAPKPPGGTTTGSVPVNDKLANDWAYSVFIGKASMSQVPGSLKNTVEGILKDPPKNWSPSQAAPTVAQDAPRSTTPTAAQGAPRSTTPSSTVPPASAVVAAVTPQTTTQSEAETARLKRLEQEAKDREANKPKPESTVAQVDLGSVLSNLNTSIETLVQLQTKIVSYSEQQLRATRGLSKDAYTAV